MQATKLGYETVIVLTQSERLQLRGLLAAIVNLNNPNQTDFMVSWLQNREGITMKFIDLLLPANLD